MGLLDDAIRDHLELKRRRGADPDEVAREQREALDPISVESGYEGNGSAQYQADLAGEAPTVAAPPTAVVEHPDTLADPGAPERQLAPEEIQETAELDMESVMGDQEPLTGAAGAGEQVEALDADAADAGGSGEGAPGA
jgi:hypothetical protein